MITKPTTSKPTVLLLHGSWHTPAHFDKLQALLTSHDYPNICPPQPTSNAFPPTSLHDDAHAIRTVLTQLVTDEGKDVLVVGHSYGCLVMTEAVTAEFSKTKRSSDGKEGGVLGLLYICGFMLPTGVGITGFFGGNLPPFLVSNESTGQCTTVGSAERFYHDLPSKEQEHYVNALVPIPAPTQYDTLTHAAYLYYPVTYLFCENDQALPVFLQRMMVERTVQGTGIKVREETCDASHSPFLSMPDRVVEVITNFVVNLVEQ